MDQSGGGGGLSQAEVDARIATYARIAPSGTIADAQIPSGIARDSELPTIRTDAEIDGRIATYARIAPSGTIATAQLPSANALDSELPASNTLCPPASTGTSGQVCATDGSVYALVDQSGGGGGGTPGTSEQRVESVTFADISGITSTAMTLTLAATTPIAVDFGDGAAEMLTGTAGETTFTIADSGVYLITFEAIYPTVGERATPFLELQQDSDDAVIGRTTNTYLRSSGSPEQGLTIVLAGVATVPSDALVVKAVLGNAYSQNSVDADGGKLSLVRIGTGLRGAAGAGWIGRRDRRHGPRHRWHRRHGRR